MLTRDRLNSVEQSKSGGLLSNGALLGSLVGAGVGIIGGVAALMGVPAADVAATAGFVSSVPMAGLSEFGVTLPIVLGSCLAGVGTIAGAFIDLSDRTDK